MHPFLKLSSSASALLALACSFASADCSHVDLRSKFGPVRNQDGVGWCYAFAAADLLNVHFKRTPFTIGNGRASGNSFSAADVAISYNEGAGKPVYANAGGIATAAKHALKRGICQESAFRSQQVYNTVNWSGSVAELNQEMKEIRLQLNHSRGARNCPSCVTKMMQELDDVFPRIDRAALERILSSPSLTHDSFLLRVRELACKGRIFRTQSSPSVIYRNVRGVEPKEQIERLLNQGRPVGISYDVNKIRQSWARGRNATPAAHASIIVGRRRRHNECQYLIRNSWGPGCDQYLYPCESGNIWVPEKALSMIFNVSWIQ